MGLTALLLHCTCRQRSVILQAASTVKAPLTEQTGEWIWGFRGISEPLRHPSPLLPKECSSFQPVLKHRNGSAEGDLLRPSCLRAVEAGSGGSPSWCGAEAQQRQAAWWVCDH